MRPPSRYMWPPRNMQMRYQGLLRFSLFEATIFHGDPWLKDWKFWILGTMIFIFWVSTHIFILHVHIFIIFIHMVSPYAENMTWVNNFLNGSLVLPLVLAPISCIWPLISIWLWCGLLEFFWSSMDKDQGAPIILVHSEMEHLPAKT